MALQLEAERERRVAHLQEVAARRIGQMGLARGWSSWYGQWAERVRQLLLVRAAGARLTRPKLAASFGGWRRDWETVVMAAKSRGQTKVLRVTLEQVSEGMRHWRHDLWPVVIRPIAHA